MRRGAPSSEKLRLLSAAGIAVLTMFLSLYSARAWGQAAPSKREPSKTRKHKLGPLNISVNWAAAVWRTCEI